MTSANTKQGNTSDPFSNMIEVRHAHGSKHEICVPAHVGDTTIQSQWRLNRCLPAHTVITQRVLWKCMVAECVSLVALKLLGAVVKGDV